MAESIKSFRQLRVYERAVELRRRVFTASEGWPRDERYALTDQARRASRSIGANVAEAWAKRRYVAHFVSKLTAAHAEAEESGVWLDVALECGYVAEPHHRTLFALCDEIGGGLVHMMAEPEKWCGPSGRVREAPSLYESDGNLYESDGNA